MMQGQGQSQMQDKDWMNAILTYEKHMSSEYATAVTESNCNTVRQMFTSLLNDTLRTQEEVFHMMSQQGWYGAPAKALRPDIDKELQTYQQSQHQLEQVLHQHRSSATQYPNYVPTQYPMSTQPSQTHRPEMYPRSQ